MKKTTALAIVLFLLLSLTSCGDSRISDRAREYGQTAIDTIEDYLSGNLDADAASDKLSFMGDLIDTYIEDQKNELGEDEWMRLYSEDGIIAHDITIAGINISLYDLGTSSKGKVKDNLKNLKDLIK